MTPRKVRLVVDAVRGLTPRQALEQLAFMRKKAALPVEKTIKQAIANAVKNANIKEENLRFQEILVGEGPTSKRWRAVSRGRAHQILKRTSHIKVLLQAKEEEVKPEPDKPLRRKRRLIPKKKKDAATVTKKTKKK